MKIYISSTFEDLHEHRDAVARVLRQMGHQPVGMEDYVAEGTRPLNRCLTDVGTCDLYVGIFAWRYGYVPADPLSTGAVLPVGSLPGVTSITEFEFRHAVGSGMRPMIFLLDPTAEWRATYVDAITGPNGGQQIAALRDELARDYLVGFFRTPEDLASAVGAAVYRREMDHQMDLESLRHTGLDMGAPIAGHGPLVDSAVHGIVTQVADSDGVEALEVNIGEGKDWWSTRLYFLASLAVDLSELKVIVFVDSDRRFIGMIEPGLVRERLAQVHPVLRRFERLISRGREPDAHAEADRRARLWENIMGPADGEQSIRMFVTRQQLKRWFGSYLLAEAVQWSAEANALVQMQRVVEWPGPFVPVRDGERFQRVVNRSAMTEQIARLFLKTQVSRLRGW